MAGFLNGTKLIEIEQKEKNDALLKEKIKRQTFEQDQWNRQI